MKTQMATPAKLGTVMRYRDIFSLSLIIGPDLESRVLETICCSLISAHTVPDVCMLSDGDVCRSCLSQCQGHGMRLQDADADAAIDNFRRNSSAASASHAPEQANGRSSQGSQVCIHMTHFAHLLKTYQP